MKTPKLLPWHARKAGVPLERAEVLWREAVHRATANTEWVGSSDFWAACNDAFLDLLTEERNRSCTAQLAPLLRIQRHIGRLPLLAMEDIVSALRAHWQPRQHA